METRTQSEGNQEGETMFRQLGITDDVTECDCCGRKGLKRTVALDSDNTGLVHFGVDCAAKALSQKHSGGIKENNTAITKANNWIGEFPQDKIVNWLHTRLGNTVEFINGQFTIVR